MSENKFGFRFVNIDFVSKVVVPQPNDFEGAFFSFDITTESSVHEEKSFVIQFVRTIIRDGDKKEPVANFTIACIFEIANFDEHVKRNEEGAYIVPNELELYLKSSAISTARGVIWSELRGGYLHYAVMPVIDVKTLVSTNQRVITGKGG